MRKIFKTFRDNPNLTRPKAPEGWQGTPVDRKDGRFLNLNHPFRASIKDVFRWKLQKNPYRKIKKSEIWRPEVFTDESWLTGNEDVIVWIGHSTFYIRISGIQLLTDPVFFDILAVKRKSPLPVNPHHFRNLDYILLSHDHRDHLDEKSLKLLAKNNPSVKYLTGLGMKPLVHEITLSDNIEAAGWYQRYNGQADITFVPSRHWSKRGLNDTNKRLWGGFVIEIDNKRILFGGDSGYDTHYRDFGKVFGGFDYAILGIGAYAPAWFMGANHQSPADALKAFKDVNAARFIPMHYGTFDLSDEPLSQPLKDLQAALEPGQADKLAILQMGKPLKI